MSATLLLLLTIAIIALVVWLGFWMVDNIGLPHPVNMIAKAVIAVIGIYALLVKTGLV